MSRPAAAEAATPGPAHATFTVERVYPHAPAKVFRAFSDPAIKRRWFAEGEGWDVHQYDLDFRVDGTEVSRFAFKGGPEIRNDTQFQLISPERMVFSYRMMMGERPISVSLSTIDLVAEGRGTRLVFTEQGIYFDGAESLKGRQEGSRWLLEQLAKELDGQG